MTKLKVFIDTNILLDALFGRVPYAESALQILNLATENKIELCFSTLSIANAIYIAKKYDVPIEDVKASLLEMHSFIEFVPLSEKNVVLQLQDGWKDFEDSLQNGCAMECGADLIVTRNCKDFKKSSLPIMEPSSLLSKILNS